MRNEIQLPDYLPNRYRSWMHLYVDIQRAFAERGELINENTTIKLYELGDYEDQKVLQEYSEEVIYFYQHFPITIIKSRALDYMLSKLPSFNIIYEIVIALRSIPSTLFESSDNRESFEDLLDICKLINAN